jgi:hypothetical protein
MAEDKVKNTLPRQVVEIAIPRRFLNLNQKLYGTTPFTTPRFKFALGESDATEAKVRKRRYLAKDTEAEFQTRVYIAELTLAEPEPKTTKEAIQRECVARFGISDRNFEFIWRQEATPAYRRRGRRRKQTG